ncbi:Pyridoxal phosphate-dependent transferase, major region, subdomain 1 [Penicillium expansum]|uniref:Pyridoxal phosphate-dependent transferase, major region, subdomain 1 n=1 Tax=Penicillium expansum TaxID=27334 RepID=A0A0A2JE54_PENEN|nr:Pyridoxal phosphate-dependent transferase, major region, subdomain 1 [Penicillium expansum]KGO45124.1 Pyridoxal phosphate-dependent transferase, major region, subdomain 1 [Penicillium expansum]KGO53667.1 Pyridoxal phosphate-dependent transferase, major region, subdomain 1 [Penicillium expansum]
MVKIEAFTVEQWMGKYETGAKYNIAETCCAPISIKDLQELSNDKDNNLWAQLQSSTIGYGTVPGSDRLRGNLASLYSAEAQNPLPKENVLITGGAILANFLLLYTLIGPGDHVICHYPTYQQLYSVPVSLGAEVSLWHSKEDDGWELDIEDLKRLIRPNTKMIIINNPQNPTGAVISRETLQSLVDIARNSSITLFSDEVYRPLFQDASAAPPSLLSFGYEKTIVTGSVSKAFSLAGLRIGWIASLDKSIIEACAAARDYTTITVGLIDDTIASFALAPECVHNILNRNINLARTNLAILERFIDAHQWACDWTKPRAGTIAFIRFKRNGEPVDDSVLCEKLLERTGVMVAPGSFCFGRDQDFRGYVRMGYVCHTKTLEIGLERLGQFLDDGYEEVPLSKKVLVPL